MGAVIDGKAYANHMEAIDFARKAEGTKVIAGGKGDDKVGWFVRPTVIETTDPDFKLLREELFGPILTVYPYADGKFEETLELCDRTSPYGLTGAIFAQRPPRDPQGVRDSRQRGGQLLHQRQADRCGRRSSAVRWRPGVRHERQGGLVPEPDPLGQPAHDQGDVRTAHRSPLSVHGRGVAPTAQKVQVDCRWRRDDGHHRRARRCEMRSTPRPPPG